MTVTSLKHSHNRDRIYGLKGTIHKYFVHKKIKVNIDITLHEIQFVFTSLSVMGSGISKIHVSIQC